MKIKSSKGIVFKKIKYSESSLVLDIYTYDYGLKSFIISGVRKSKSKAKASIYNLMNLIEIEFYDSDSQKLSRIKEGRMYYKYNLLSFDVIHASLGTFMLEMTRNAVKEHEANEQLYLFIEKWFSNLDKGQSKLRYYHIFYLIELTKFIGFYPNNNYSEDKPYFDLLEGRFVSDLSASNHVLHDEDSLLLHYIFSAQIMKVLNGSISLELNSQQRDRILDHIVKYYAVHLDNMTPIKSLDVLRTIMS